MEEALQKYYEAFGKHYPLVITSQLSDDEIIKDINRCIADGKQAEEPEYEDENIY